ncbi:hypothetical protein [Chelatococcus reniformis]|uniref:DNA methyltransferase n=1 Tax=Chelatococcus reniformis TaxID=1494448 RepID=A0A916UWC3_9HYPH|nr:hypothetical protein [Chelatococcus reniformis]GGC90896.1 hypothetical protein GCM10010994_55870 [Chelatococcus reniformis]
MEQLLPIILQLIGGAAGGNAIGSALKNLNLGPLGNTIAGAVGGGVLGQLLQGLLPALQGAGGMDIASIAGNLVGGGVTGAIVTAVVGLIVKRLRPA